MNILLIILAVIAGLILLIVLFGFMSPRITRMERSIEINASVEKVFEQMNSLKNFVANWSPFSDYDPNMKKIFNHIETGKGAHYTWEGDPKKVGKGTMEITHSVVNKSVTTHLAFHGRGEADATWTIQPGNGNVKVTWDFMADNKNNPISRIFGRMMDRFLGPDYEKGLKKLKEYCEK
ncbi:MAG: SRPBCC family protein [Bacteroidota bacterium]